MPAATIGTVNTIVQNTLLSFERVIQVYQQKEGRYDRLATSYAAATRDPATAGTMSQGTWITIVTLPTATNQPPGYSLVGCGRKAKPRSFDRLI